MQVIGGWGTTLAIDHPRAPQPGITQADYRPYGNAYKYHLARSVIQIVPDGAGVLRLRHRKINFGPLGAQLRVAVEFAGRAVRFDERALGTDAPAADEHLPVAERVATALAQHPQGASPDELGTQLGMSPKTARNHLTALKHQGRAEPLGAGRWRAVPHPDPGRRDSAAI